MKRTRKLLCRFPKIRQRRREGDGIGRYILFACCSKSNLFVLHLVCIPPHDISQTHRQDSETI